MLVAKPPKRIPVSALSYGQPEIDEVMDSLKSGWLTMGEKVKRFESMWAEYIGVKHAVMVNSGSSANLLALSALELEPGAEVITPALTWATTVFPICQAGAVPVLVDVDLETFNMNTAAAEAAVTTQTRAIMPVHLLGRPCDTRHFQAMQSHYPFVLIEDACEAHGARWQMQKVGSLGQVGTFSFNFSHHISTVEGGMVVTNNDKRADFCRSMRSFGWSRDVPHEPVEGIDERFLFLRAGYNFKPTELQGAFGIHQLPRLEGIIAHRRALAAYWNEALKPYKQWLMLPKEQPGTRHVFFAYPIMVRPGAPFSAQLLKAHMEKRNVETRPIEAGNIALQPAMKRLNYRISGTLDNATYIHNNAFFIGCHPGIGAEEQAEVAEYFHEFLRGF